MASGVQVAGSPGVSQCLGACAGELLRHWRLGVGGFSPHLKTSPRHSTSDSDCAVKPSRRGCGHRWAHRRTRRHAGSTEAIARRQEGCGGRRHRLGFRKPQRLRLRNKWTVSTVKGLVSSLGRLPQKLLRGRFKSMTTSCCF